MENTVSRIPKYPTSVPMRSTTIRISEIQRSNLDRIIKATNAQSIGASIRLLINAEITAIRDGLRTPIDYIPTREPKLYTIGFKLSEADTESLSVLRKFYSAQSISDTVCHLLNGIIVELTKDGE